jgi:hypothetical protein
MFKGAALGLLAIVGAATPASAQVFSLSINGVVSGTQTTVMCSPSATVACLQTYPSGTTSQQFLQAFDVPLYTGFLAQGANSFSFGNSFSTGLWSGTINNSGGYLTGQNLTFVREDSSCRFGTVGCQSVIASALVFNVAGGVPEPGTWATMLLGFALAGTALRKNSRRLRLATQ